MAVLAKNGLQEEMGHLIDSTSFKARLTKLGKIENLHVEVRSGLGLHPSTLAEGLAVKGVSMRRSGQTAADREADEGRG